MEKFCSWSLNSLPEVHQKWKYIKGLKSQSCSCHTNLCHKIGEKEIKLKLKKKSKTDKYQLFIFSSNGNIPQGNFYLHSNRKSEDAKFLERSNFRLFTLIWLKLPRQLELITGAQWVASCLFPFLPVACFVLFVFVFWLCLFCQLCQSCLLTCIWWMNVRRSVGQI